MLRRVCSQLFLTLWLTLRTSRHISSIYVYDTDNLSRRPTRLVVAGKPHNEERERTGSFLWGANDMLFASTEADDDSIACRHAAFDMTTSRRLGRFSVTESGDTMAISPSGKFSCCFHNRQSKAKVPS